MKVEGDLAHGYTAVRLDSFESVEGKGVLVYADDSTGECRWKDKADQICAKTLGPHMISIQPRGPR